MKKTIVASILGITASLAMVSSSHAQGFIQFCNYANGGALTAPVTISGSGLTAGPSYTADLLYSLNGGVSYVDSGATASFLGGFDGDTANGAGLFGFQANTVTIPGYTSGNVYFKIEVYNGASYGNSLITGISAPIILNSLATAANQLPTGSLLSDNSAAITPLAPFTVTATAVPEPTTLALAGLGGLASLVAFRRKQA